MHSISYYVHFPPTNVIILYSINLKVRMFILHDNRLATEGYICLWSMTYVVELRHIQGNPFSAISHHIKRGKIASMMGSGLL